MSGSWAHVLWTVLLLIVFVGIVLWAWSGRQKRRFEQAARLPFADERPDREEQDG